MLSEELLWLILMGFSWLFALVLVGAKVVRDTLRRRISKRTK